MNSLTRPGLPLIALSSLLLNGCYYFGTVSEEAFLLAPLLDGQSFSGNEVVLQQGQAMSLEFVVSKNDKPKDWKVTGESLDPSYATVYATEERNHFVITGIQPGQAELRFRVSDKRWYTARKVFLDVTINSPPDWNPTATPSPRREFGAGGFGGADSDD